MSAFSLFSNWFLISSNSHRLLPGTDAPSPAEYHRGLVAVAAGAKVFRAGDDVDDIRETRGDAALLEKNETCWRTAKEAPARRVGRARELPSAAVAALFVVAIVSYSEEMLAFLQKD
jgi:hypothetical protein